MKEKHNAVRLENVLGVDIQEDDVGVKRKSRNKGKERGMARHFNLEGRLNHGDGRKELFGLKRLPRYEVAELRRAVGRCSLVVFDSEPSVWRPCP